MKHQNQYAFMLLFAVCLSFNSLDAQVSATENILGQLWSKGISREIVNMEIETTLTIPDMGFQNYRTFSFMAASSGELSAVIYKSTDENLSSGLILLFYDAARNYSLRKFEGGEAKSFIFAVQAFRKSYEEKKKDAPFPKFVFRYKDIRIEMSESLQMYILWNGYRSALTYYDSQKFIKRGLEIL
jgi:hypothetical protein